MEKGILVIGCGSLAANDINIALRDIPGYKLYGASDRKNHGEYVYKNYISDIPNIKEDNFIEMLNNNIEKYNIKFIIPTHEDMALYLQENRDNIKANIICSEYDTALLCRYKSKTYKKLEKYDFVPKTYKKEDVKDFPVFIKKDNDQGARHAYKVNNQNELDLYAKEDMIICEFLPGEEVTVDCFTNRSGELLFCNPRVADRMLAGIDVHARRIKSEEITNIASLINKEIKFRGFWFFQVKKDINGKYKLLEISTRLPGAFSLSRCLDVNLPLLAVKDFDGENVKISFNDINIEADKQFFGKYKLDINYSTVFLDIDSCIIKTNYINTLLMMYLYQCINKNIKLIGITSNYQETIKNLKNKRIATDLFTDIIENKNIENIEFCNNSIYISNEETNRIYVRENKKIYSFSNNIIECLLDWRA